jgi:uncharacterized protein (DUF2236 family)
MPADTGLFGPSSVTWQLHADPAMWFAGVRALYLQALHPMAVRGAYQHSTFKHDPLGRLWRTGDFVGVVTYGTTAQAEQAGARVRAIHRRLRGVCPETGRRFPLNLPELLLWVHCAEVSSFLTVVRRAGLQLTDEQADRYVDEQRRAAALVGLNQRDVPGSVAELDSYFDRIRPQLRAVPESHDVMAFLRRPPVSGWQVVPRLAWTQLSTVAYSLLPWWAQDLYGHRGLPESTTTGLLRVIRRAASTVPDRPRWKVCAPRITEAMTRLGNGTAPSIEQLSTARAPLGVHGHDHSHGLAA